jgi:UDP:flavonoid glycosyltransferase YjiC (YdhE family)
MNNNKKLIGFFPLTFNLAETGRSILVAKRYADLGGKPIFFSHGGLYETLIKEFEFDLVRVKPFFDDKIVNHIINVNRKEKKGVPYTLKYLREAVSEEIKAFKEMKIKMVVSFVNLPSSISTRAVKIPLVTVSPAPGIFYLRIPDNYENLLTRFFPQMLKIPITNYLFNNSKIFLKPFNIVAREYNVKSFKSTIEVMRGDITLATNFFSFINVFPNQQLFPRKNYIGMISLEEIFSKRFSEIEKKNIEQRIRNHVDKKQKSILLTFGSSGDKILYNKIVNLLNNSDHRVIAVYANIFNNQEIPNTNENILLFNFVPSIDKLHELVDLSIIHGGQGTVYSAAYAGKPMIGFPMNPEQHLNLEKIEGHGAGIMLSKKYFNEKILLNSIDTIFDNYSYYYRKAQKLKNVIPRPNGDKKAAKFLIDFSSSL